MYNASNTTRSKLFARSLFSRDINPRSLALFMRNEPFTLCHARAHFYSDWMYYKALRNDFRDDTLDNTIDGRRAVGANAT